jgi:NADH dehydrogenase
MDVVTGAFGYIGRYITAHLLECNRGVKTITTHVDKPNPFGEQVEAFPYNFDHPRILIKTLKGIDTLYNTYWVRFDYGGVTFDQAVRNTRTLFNCAAEAGVKHIVHISVTNPSLDSPLPYYRGKALQEEALKECGVSYSIVRPTLVFGKEDILVNNIAWLIRNFPIFPIFGDGKYRVQPVYVRDLASIAFASSRQMQSAPIDAIGPESYTFEELVKLIARRIGRNVAFVYIPPALGIASGRIIGLFLRDVLLTRDELDGLMANLLTSQQQPNGEIKFSEWLARNQHTIGASYSSELDRHFRYKA